MPCPTTARGLLGHFLRSADPLAKLIRHMLYTHTHTHTHTHTRHGVEAVWPPARQGTAAVCEWCELLVRVPRCDLRSDQGRPSYVWRRVRLLDGGHFVGRTKKEGRNSYGGGWYMFYGKSNVEQTGPRAGRVVLILPPALNLLHRRPILSSV